MKTSAVIVACLCGCAYSHVAKPPVQFFKRDAAAVTAAIDSVGKNLAQLDQGVKNFNSDMVPLAQSSDQLVAALQDGKTRLDASEPMTVTGAMTLAQPGQNVQAQAQALVTDLKARKPDIEKAGGCDIAREKVGAINANSQALLDSVVEKAPPGAATFGDSLTTKIRAMLDDAGNEFSPENCKNAPGAGGK